MSENNGSGYHGISFAGLLTVVFVVLKLTGVIVWSWWWVLSPMLFSLAVVVLLLLICVPIVILAARRGD